MSRRFELIMFDVGGVLVEYDQRRHFARMAQAIGADPGAFREKAIEQALKLERGNTTLREAERTLSSFFGSPNPSLRGLWESEFQKSVSPRHGMLKLVERLSKNGMKIAITTNTTVADCRYLYGRRGPLRSLRKKYPIFGSCFIGFAKPSRFYYGYVLSKMKAKKKSSILVDDSRRNIRGARHFGLRTVRFVGQDQLEKELRKLDVL